MCFFVSKSNLCVPEKMLCLYKTTSLEGLKSMKLFILKTYSTIVIFLSFVYNNYVQFDILFVEMNHVVSVSLL